MLLRTLLLPVTLASFFISAKAAKADTFNVTSNVWGDINTVGTFAWAINEANQQNGLDIINLIPANGNQIAIDSAVPVFSSFLSQITDSVLIEGRGTSLVGNPSFIATNGIVYTKTTVSEFGAGVNDVLTQAAFSFARVSSGVDVIINELSTDGMNAFLDLQPSSSATISGGSMTNTVPYGFGSRPVFSVNDDATLNLVDVHIDRVNTFDEPVAGAEFAWAGAIGGSNATLNMTKSSISTSQGGSSAAGALNWINGKANVVSSVIDGGSGMGGISISEGGELNFVNSLLRIDAANDAADTRLQAYDGGIANILASTILADNLTAGFSGCGSEPTNYRCTGYPLRVFNNGEINLESTVVSMINYDVGLPLNNPAYDASPLDSSYGPSTGGSFSADEFSFISPTSTQDSAALHALFGQPSLLTEGEPFDLFAGFAYLPLPDGAYPAAAGPLINIIPDADLSNQLINPIDGSSITHDVFGNKRTANGFRDIGAVQATQEVPGPLPLFGIITAFRYSRKMRRLSDRNKMQPG